MVQFADAFPDAKIVAALRRQLSWTHFKTLLSMKDPLKRDFYAEMCRIEGWSSRVLQKKVDGMLYERTALSKKPERQPGEEPPVAIILCAGKKSETVEYLDLDRSGIHVAEYLTALPPREVLRKRFHDAIAAARSRLEQREVAGNDSEP